MAETRRDRETYTRIDLTITSSRRHYGERCSIRCHKRGSYGSYCLGLLPQRYGRCTWYYILPRLCPSFNIGVPTILPSAMLACYLIRASRWLYRVEQSAKYDLLMRKDHVTDNGLFPQQCQGSVRLIDNTINGQLSRHAGGQPIGREGHVKISRRPVPVRCKWRFTVDTANSERLVWARS